MWVERWCGGNVCDFRNVKATLFNGIGNMLDHVKPPQTHDGMRFNALIVNLFFIGDGRFGGERKSDVSAGDMATSRDFQAGPT